MIRPLIAAVLALTFGANFARAEEGDLLTGTLKTIRDRGTIRIGYRTSAIPFAFLNRAGQPVGFSLDICHAIAAEAAQTLGRDLLEPDAPAWQSGIRIAFVPTAADERLPKLVAGDIDLECGSTTANAERAKTVAFSPIFFLAGTKLMAKATANIATYRDLGGRTVVAAAGTTNLDVIRRLAPSLKPPITVAEAPSIEAAYALLTAGAADALASDDILLAGLAATHPEDANLRIVGDYLSFEPYAIAYRRDDPEFTDLVKRSFETLATDGTLRTLYNRWFTERLPNGEHLDLPMSAQLAEMYRGLGQPD